MAQLTESCPVCNTLHRDGTPMPYGSHENILHAHLLFLMQDYLDRSKQK